MRLLDDKNYAEMLVRHYATKGYGKYRVRDELYRRKVPKDMWDEALLQMPEQDAAIDRFVEKRLKTRNPDRAELKKLSDALTRRGYSWDEIKSAIARFTDSIEEEY